MNYYIGSNFATIHRVRVHGCSVAPCSFRVGQPIEVEVEATTREWKIILNNILLKVLRYHFHLHTVAHSANLPFRVTASVFGLPIPLLEGNACEHLSLGHCPALSGHTFIFHLQYVVNDRIPPVRKSTQP